MARACSSGHSGSPGRPAPSRRISGLLSAADSREGRRRGAIVAADLRRRTPGARPVGAVRVEQPAHGRRRCASCGGFTPGRIPTFMYPETVGGLINCLAELGFATSFVVDRIAEALAAGHGGADVTVLIGAGSRGGSWRPGDGPLRGMACARSEGGGDGHLPGARGGRRPECGRCVAGLVRREGELPRPPRCAAAESVVRRARGTAGRRVRREIRRDLGSWRSGWLDGRTRRRAGAAEVEIKDKSWVGPGLLVRQPYSDDDVLQSKAQRLAERLDRISSQTHVTGS